MRLLSGLVLTVVFLTSAAPTWSGGLLVPSRASWGEATPITPRLPVQRAIIYRPDTSSQVLVVQPAYHGPEKEFCWIVPVPNRPGPEDVFLASQDFVDAVFERTAPVVSTELLDPRHPSEQSAGLQGTAESTPLYSPTRASEWLATGDYRIDRPSRRNCERLAQWLEASGYQVPAGLEQAIKSYLARDWRFVVVKVYPQADSPRRVSARLRPLGIRFATKQPVYPLALSRLGAPQITALELVVIAPVPVILRSAPAEDLSGQVALDPGEGYEDYRAREAGGMLVRESVVRGACEYADVHYEARRWMGVRNPRWGKLWATRFFGLLPPGSLSDLVFGADPQEAPFRVHVARTREQSGARDSGWLSRDRVKSAIPGLLLLAAGLLLWGAGLTADQPRAKSPGDREPSAVGYVGRLVVYGGALLLLPTALHALGGRLDTVRDARLFVSGQMPLASTCLWAGLILVWSVACIAFVVRNRRGQGRARWLFGTVAALVWAALAVTVVFAPSDAMREASRLGTTECLAVAQTSSLLAITSLAALLGCLAQLGLAGSARGQYLSAEFLVLLMAWSVLVPRGVPANVAASDPQESAHSRLVRERALLQDAVADFAGVYGCFPGSLDALVRDEAPKTGLDEAGNPATPNAPRGKPKRFLARIPLDPLSGKPGDWLYDPLTPALVESGAFRVQVSAPTRDAAVAPELRQYWDLPRVAGVRDALGPVAPMIWGEGDALFRLAVGSDGVPVARAVAVRHLKGALVRVAGIRGVSDPRLAAVPGTTNLALTCGVRRESRAGVSGEAGSARTAVFEVSSAGHRMAVMGPPIRGVVTELEPAPDGVRVACIVERPGPSGKPVRQLWALGDGGEWLGPLAQDVARVAWHPSGMPLFALIRDAGKAGAAKRHCRLVQIWPDGRVDTVEGKRRFRETILATNIRSVFALDAEGKLQMIPLRRGSVRPLETGGGEVADFHCLHGERTAVLLRGSRGTRSGEPADRLIIHDMRGRAEADLSPVAPDRVQWNHGLVIGQHDSTGYLFLHLWQEEPNGGEIILLGEDKTPPQGLALISR